MSEQDKQHASTPAGQEREFDRWRQSRRSGRSGSTTGGNFGPAADSGDVHTPSSNRSESGNPGREPRADGAPLHGDASDATRAERDPQGGTPAARPGEQHRS
ncbi:hypothetical protein WG922_06590 [Ramlibacter sp. AN1015]|uniref:hypothetical protein n=1 Tax=Ramlibacter sp. AN1015 TaxID=3133428 RepID=UPI0030BF5E3F